MKRRAGETGQWGELKLLCAGVFWGFEGERCEPKKG